MVTRLGDCACTLRYQMMLNRLLPATFKVRHRGRVVNGVETLLVPDGPTRRETFRAVARRPESLPADQRFR